MATAEEKSESSDCEKDAPEIERLFRDVAEILYHLSPEDMAKFRVFNHKFEKIAESVQSRREYECLYALKSLTKVGTPKNQGIIRKVIFAATLLLQGKKKREIAQLKVCSCHVTEMNFSSDPESIENPDPILEELANHCQNIETLNLNSCNVSAKGIRALKSLVKLKSISLCFCEQMNEEVLSAVAELRQLKKLKLCWNRNLPVKGIEKLISLTHLDHLDISHSNISDAELKSIGKLKNLISLNCEECPNVTDQGINFLRELTSLKILNLSSCSIADEGLVKIINFFPNLKTLELRMNRFSDKAVSLLKKLKQLRSLDLSFAMNLKGTFLEALSELPDLQILCLSHCKIMNPVCKKWKDFQSLIILDMSYCRINDAALHEMAFIPNLTNASFSYSDSITLFGVHNLSQMPHLRFLNLIYCGLNKKDVQALFSSPIELSV